MRSAPSKLLRHEQCVEQVDHQKKTNNQHQDGFKRHGFSASPNPIAKSHVANGGYKEQQRENDEERVSHKDSSLNFSALRI
jgi:hypothetical protein